MSSIGRSATIVSGSNKIKLTKVNPTIENLETDDSILKSSVNYKYSFIELSNKYEVLKNIIAFKIDNI